MTVSLPTAYQLTVSTPGSYDPVTVQGFLNAVAAQIAIYVTAKAELTGLSTGLTSGSIASGPYAFPVVDTTLLGQMETGASGALTALEAAYGSLIAQVKNYMVSVVSADQS